MIGEKRVREAAAIAGVDVRLTFVPFLLNPNLPDSGISLAQYYSNQYGPSRYPAMELPNLQKLEPNIHWKVYEPSDEPNVGRTLHAHRLLAWARRRFGPQAAERVMGGLNRLYFVEAGLLSSYENLVRVAEEAELDMERSEVMTYLQSDEDHDAILSQDLLVKTTKNIHAVPHMVIAVQGLESDTSTVRMELPLAAPEQMAQIIRVLLEMSVAPSNPSGMKVQLDGL